MAEPRFNEKNGVELSPELKSSLDLIQDKLQDIQDATFVHNEILSFSQQLNITSPHMPPHQFPVDSDDESDEDYDYDFVNDEDCEDSDIDDNDFSEKIKMEVFNRPPSRLGRPLSNPYKRSTKRNGPSIDRIKMENAFLKNQNNKLAQELEQCRLTIQALKGIVTQKDLALQNSRTENQKAIIQTRLLETLISSKHSKDGSVIVRSGSIIDNNLPSIASLLQDKETLKRMDVPRKPTPQEFDSIEPAPLQVSQLTHPPLLETATDSLGSFNNNYNDNVDDDDDDLKPPPLPPKRANRHIRRWSMDFGTNNRLGQDEDEGLASLNINSDISNITQRTSSDDNTIISSSGTTPSSSTLTPVNNDMQLNLPRLLKRRTGDIIQSLASCRSSSTKNGYDNSPPSTPSEGDCDESNDPVINEKSTKKKKSAQQNLSKLRKIFLR